MQYRCSSISLEGILIIRLFDFFCLTIHNKRIRSLPIVIIGSLEFLRKRKLPRLLIKQVAEQLVIPCPVLLPVIAKSSFTLIILPLFR